MTRRERLLEAIAREENLAAEATPGPWRNVDEGRGSWSIIAADSACVAIRPVWQRIRESNANGALIARSRTLLPALLGVVRKLAHIHGPSTTRPESCFGCPEEEGGYYPPLADCPILNALYPIFGVSDEG